MGKSLNILAEAVRFELTEGLPPRRFSSPQSNPYQIKYLRVLRFRIFAETRPSKYLILLSAIKSMRKRFSRIRTTLHNRGNTTRGILKFVAVK